MTKEEKRQRKIKRRKYRNARRMEKYVEKIKNAEGPSWLPLSCAKPGGAWPDSNSPTGYSQVCSYQGICQSPCNGDC